MQNSRTALLIKLQIADATRMHYRWRRANRVYTWRYAKQEFTFSEQTWLSTRFSSSKVLARVRSHNEVSVIRHVRWAEYWDSELNVIAERLGVAVPLANPAQELHLPCPTAVRKEYNYGYWSQYDPDSGRLRVTRVHLGVLGSSQKVWTGRFQHSITNSLFERPGEMLTWQVDVDAGLPTRFDTSLDMVTPVLNAISRCDYATAAMLLALE